MKALFETIKELFKSKPQAKVVVHTEPLKPEEPRKNGKVKVLRGKLIRVTAGGRHGYFESNVGIIKKPL